MAVATMNSPFDLGFPSYASKRASMMSTATGSTTKSTLRASNAALIDMLQNIQSELQSHRSLMLDISQGVKGLDRRVSGLELSQPHQSIEDGDRRQSGRSDTQIEWLEACNNFARNSNPPISASEFLRTPGGKSLPKTPVPPKSAMTVTSHGLSTPPATPPDESDDSDDSFEHSDVDEVQIDSVTVGPDGTIQEVQVSPAPRSLSQEYASSPDSTRTVEIEVGEDSPPPLVPVLQRAPTPKRRQSEEEKAIGESQKKAAEQFSGPPMSGPPRKSSFSPGFIKAVPSRRMYQGKRSLSSFEAKLHNKKSEKGHTILIHFHRAKDLKKEE